MKWKSHNIFYDAKGYPLVWINGKSCKVHILVWEEINGSRPKGYNVHHKDFDKTSFIPENLELLSNSDHQKIHAGWIKKDGKWHSKPCSTCKQILSLDNFYQRKGYTPSANCKKCHCDKTKQWAKKNKKLKKSIALKSYHKNKPTILTKEKRSMLAKERALRVWAQRKGRDNNS